MASAHNRSAAWAPAGCWRSASRLNRAPDQETIIDVPSTKTQEAERGDEPTEGDEPLAAQPGHNSARLARWALWRVENAAAIASSNAWVERHGLPLDRYRLF